MKNLFDIIKENSSPVTLTESMMLEEIADCRPKQASSLAAVRVPDFGFWILTRFYEGQATTLPGEIVDASAALYTVASALKKRFETYVDHNGDSGLRLYRAARELQVSARELQVNERPQWEAL